MAPCDNSLARFEAGEWRLFSEANGLRGETISAAIADREGSIWIGILGQGLQRWRGYGEWEHWTKDNGLHSNIVWGVIRDRSGRLWVGDDKSVSVMAPGSNQLRSWSVAGVPAGGFVAMATSKDGFLWIGFRNRYVVRVDSATLATRNFPIGDLSRIFADSRSCVGRDIGRLVRQRAFFRLT